MANARIDRAGLCAKFDAAIDVLEAALRDCPDELWAASMWQVPRTDRWMWPQPGVEPIPERTEESIQRFSAFWVIAHHCLWFLDFYVRADPTGFASPEYVRGGPPELPWPADGAAPLPEGSFSREALLRYAEHGRNQIRERIESMPEAEFQDACGPHHPHAGKTLLELLDVNLEHVIEHGGQMAGFVRDRASA
jgi:hypothetical protein